MKWFRRIVPIGRWFAHSPQTAELHAHRANVDHCGVCFFEPVPHKEANMETTFPDFETKTFFTKWSEQRGR